ncbi:hypothetical protein D6745_03960 [Candidatus Woesearchaeota archaeon]|nr:MAG: hypothetical protein D6745_03960 [Candidatus Woesearchaeota archaeon]
MKGGKMSKKIIISALVLLLIVGVVAAAKENIGMLKIPKKTKKKIPQKPQLIAGVDYVPGQYIVKFKSSYNNKEAISKISEFSLAKENNIKMIQLIPNSESKKFGLDRIYLVKIPRNINVLKEVERIKKSINVEYAEPDYIYYGDAVPNDEDFWRQYELHNTGQIYKPPTDQGIYDADIDAPEAWDLTQGSSNVVIAVIDSGVNWTHIDLVNKIWSNSDEIIDGTDTDGNGYIDDVRGWDFILFPPPLCWPTEDCDSTPDNDPNDVDGHGTAVAAIAGAQTFVDTQGMAGVCPNCEIMPLKACIKQNDGKVGCSEGAIIPAIDYAVNNGASIVSMSFGGVFSSGMNDTITNYYQNNNIIFVASAGNENGNSPKYPAALDSVISVGGTNASDERWVFSGTIGSNYGSWVDISAAAADIYTTAISPDGLCPGTLNGYNYCSGTSASAPFVSGVAGLLLSYNPSLTNQEVYDILINSADPISTDQPIGGRLNANNALHYDLEVTDLVKIYPDNPVVGEPVYFRFNIRNNGFVNITNVNWKLESGSNIKTSSQPFTIKGQDTFTVIDSLTFSSAGTHNITASTDYTTTISEINETNNNKTITITIT